MNIIKDIRYTVPLNRLMRAPKFHYDSYLLRTSTLATHVSEEIVKIVMGVTIIQNQISARRL